MNKIILTRLALLIFVNTLVISCGNNSLDIHKNKDETSKLVTNKIDTTIATIDTSRTNQIKKVEPAEFSLSNIKEYTNENFEKSVSFTFINNSKEVITNILFQEEYYPAKNKKNNFTNKKVNLKPNDSTRFVFKKNHDELLIYKIRFSSGNSISLGDDFMKYNNVVYDNSFDINND